MSELQQLRDRVAELEDVIGVTAPPRYDLAYRKLLRRRGRAGPCARALFGMLLKRDLVTRDGAYAALYGMRVESQKPEIKVLDIYICDIRRVLKSYGIEMESLRGEGAWRINVQNKRKLRALLDSMVQAA